jgi:hypothetical protein
MTPREFVAAMIERGVADARLDDPGCMTGSHPYGTLAPGRVVFLGREGGEPCIYDPDEPLPRTVFVEVASEGGETLLAYDDVTVTGALRIIARLVQEETARLAREETARNLQEGVSG